MTQFCALENLPGAEITPSNLRARDRRPTSFVESLLFYLFAFFIYSFIYCDTVAVFTFAESF